MVILGPCPLYTAWKLSQKVNKRILVGGGRMWEGGRGANVMSGHKIFLKFVDRFCVVKPTQIIKNANTGGNVYIYFLLQYILFIRRDWWRSL